MASVGRPWGFGSDPPIGLGRAGLGVTTPDTWHTVSHSKCAKCPVLCSLPRKMCKFQMSQNSTKFDVAARFRETIPTMKSVLSSEI